MIKKISGRKKRSSYSINKDYQNYSYTFPINRVTIPVMRKISKIGFDMQKTHVEVKREGFTISGYQEMPLDLELYSPVFSSDKMPCLLFMHGGAFVLSAAPFHKLLINDYVLQTPCKVLFVDYHLAPEYPYPHGLEDGYAALLWLLEHSDQLGVDKESIALYGDSAGGNLAAALAHLSRDRMGNPFLFQSLVYPVTDSRMETPSMINYSDTPLWNSQQNRNMWDLYLSSKEPLLDLKYSSPNQAENFNQLPPCYLEVAEFDCLRDEGLEYAETLKSSGINTEIHQTKGTIHGFESNYKSPYTQSIIERRIQYFRSKFY